MPAVISTVDLIVIPEADVPQVPVEAEPVTTPVQDVADDIDTDEL